MTMNTQEAKAIKTGSAFRMDCAIRATIHASPDRIWALLTDAAAFPRWNSTVTSIEGQIAEGQTLKLKGRSMIWSDGMAPMFKGVRTFTLTPNSDGSTEFSMKEEFSGLMLPMIKGSLPDFAPVFETYVKDLKRAAEGSAS